MVEMRRITILWEDRELNHLTAFICLGEQIRSRCRELRQKLSGAAPMVPRFRRRSPRVYFVLTRHEREGRLKSRIDGFLDSPWSAGIPPHFERVYCQ